MSAADAACIRPDGSIFTIQVPLRNLVVRGAGNIQECGEKLAQQLQFGHFGVPRTVIAPQARLCDVPGISVMILQLKSLTRGYLLAVRPSKTLSEFPENLVASKMLSNQQLKVYGSAIFVRHTYASQGNVNSYTPVGVAEVKAVIKAVPGVEGLMAAAQKAAAERRAEQELVQEFSARPLAASAAAAVGTGSASFSLRSFGTQLSQPSPANAPTQLSQPSPANAPAARPSAVPATPQAAVVPVLRDPQVLPQRLPTQSLPEPCPICANSYQVTHHVKQKMMCCKQRLCSDCSSEILRRGPSGRGTPCPFCRYNPFEVQVVAADSEDELESQEARRARMAEDHQLAQVLQDIEEEGLSNWAKRVAPRAPEKSWLATAQEGRVKALEQEVAQLRSMLHSRTACRARPAPAMATSSGSSQPTAAVARSNAKTVLCRYHQLGRCSKGAACSYAHGEAELQATSGVASVRQPAMLGGAVDVTPRRVRLW